MKTLTGSVLCTAQPLPLGVALDADDVHTVSLLQTKVSFIALTVHTSLALVDNLYRSSQLKENSFKSTCILKLHVHWEYLAKQLYKNVSWMSWSSFPHSLTLNFFLASFSFFSRSFCSFFSDSRRFFSSLLSFSFFFSGFCSLDSLQNKMIKKRYVSVFFFRPLLEQTHKLQCSVLQLAA